MKAIILAAGYATRLYPLTIDRPKALLPVGRQPMLNYLMDGIATLPGLDEAVIVSNHRFYGQFLNWAQEAQPRYAPMRLRVLDDGTTGEENRLGAVGDMAFAVEHAQVDDDVLVAASDNFFTFPLADFYGDFRRHGRDTLLAARIDDVESLRRMAVATLDAENRVTSLVEKPADPPSDIAVYALYFYRRDTLPLIRKYLSEGNAPDAPGHFPEWLHAFRDVRAWLFEGECIDIGTVESYEAVCRRFAREQANG